MSKKELAAFLRELADRMAFQAACARREKELRLIKTQTLKVLPLGPMRLYNKGRSAVRGGGII